MTVNLLQAVQENLGYPPLHKVDANTEKIIADEKNPEEDRFSQSAIPAVLTAFFTYSRTDEGAEAILHSQLTNGWANFIFGDHKSGIVKSIADYSDHRTEDALKKINSVASETVRVIRQQVTASGEIEDVKNLLAHSQQDVLLYLPAALRVGKLLYDDTLDDKTHKMEGPVSSLMHSIGGSFAGSGNDKV